MSDAFRRFAVRAADHLGHHGAFLAALLLVAGWLCTGPLFHWSDTWQIVINTTTSVITFLMVFIVQSTQNRDARAVQLKLDELIRAQVSARTELAHLEEAGESEVQQLEDEFRTLRQEAAERHVTSPLP
jgi:low affinity Fe/Cu permease